MKKVMTLLLAVGFAFAFSACNKKACKRAYECLEEDGYDLDMSEDEYVEECEEDLDEEDKDCQRAFRSVARCLDRNDCDETECMDEAEELFDACDF